MVSRAFYRLARRLPTRNLGRLHPRFRAACYRTVLLLCRWIGVIALYLITLSLLANTNPAQAQTPQQAGAGVLYLLDTSGASQPAVHLHTDVSMSISGMTARVRLLQSFSNAGSSWVEGTYVFPLPEDSAVNKMKLQLSNREIVGEVHERAAAKQIYQQARSEGRKAALVEQQRPNLFTQKVANIAPGETVTVELQYIQAIRYDNGRFSLRLPLTLTPRYIPGSPHPALAVSGTGWAQPTAEVPDADQITPPYLAAPAINPLTLKVQLHAGLPLSTLHSPSHDLNTTTLPGNNGDYELTLRDANTGMDRDFELEWQPRAGSEPQAAVFFDQVDNDSFVQLMLLPPQVLQPASRIGRELIIVLDTSGSMDGNSIVQAKQAVEVALGRLQPGDFFNVVEFNSGYWKLFAASMQATPQQVQLAQQFVRQLSARGGTEMYAALEYALGTPPVSNGSGRLIKQVVFITDGSVGNEAAIFALIRQRLGDTRLFTVGIGSAPNSYFMRNAAETGRGTFTHISDLAQVNSNMDLLLRKLDNAVMADVAVQWPAGIDAEAYPARVPDLYLGEPLFITARLSSALPARAVVTVNGAVAGQRWERQLRLNNTQTSSNSTRTDSALASYWARQKITQLLDGLRSGIDEQQVRSDVLAVALPFQLLSPYTSFVAAERTVSRPREGELQGVNVPNQPPAGQTLANEMAAQQLQLTYPRTAAGTKEHFFKSFMLGLLALLLIYRQLMQGERRG